MRLARCWPWAAIAGAALLPSATLAQVATLPPGAAAASTAAASPGGSVTSLPDVTVVGSTPLLGSGIDRSEVPAQTNVVTGADLARTGPASVLRGLDENIGGISLDQATGNQFQPNLLFRGFEASPLVGDAQGLAVYVNGTRFNQAFGDTTNWDLIPDIAIDRVDVEGSNPAFGLNALGGSVSVLLKNGFTYHGNEVEVSGGSFGRIQGSFQSGRQSGNTSLYVGGTLLNEDGWREDSPSQERQIYGDLGWRNETTEIHLSLSAADNVLVGNGTTPIELLAADRAAVFTYPDETRNKYLRVTTSAQYDVTDTWSLQGNAYYSNLSQRTLNGDAGDDAVCDDDSSIVCADSGPLTDRGGKTIPNFIQNSPYVTAGFGQFASGGPYSVLNTTATDTNAYGVSVQATNTNRLFTRPNHFVVGASYDGGVTEFTAATLLGGFTLDRDFFGPGIEIDSPDNDVEPVRVHTTNDYYGVFATDTLDVTRRLSMTVSARFNSAQIDLSDELGTSLSGQHSYNRINPGAGFTYKILPNTSAYFGYSEANRAPTPAELSCASPDAPCSLTNFFVGDPDLKQVVAHTYEAGFRGSLKPYAGSDVTWHAGVFRTDLDDDIQFVTSETIGRAYFENIGSTRRQGVEAGASLHTGRLYTFLDYAYTEATYQNALTLNSEDNPFADENGLIQVAPGNRLPGIPAHVLKFGAQYGVTPRWIVGLTGRASSGQYLFGDEANLDSKTRPYVLLNVNTSYQLTKNFQLFGLVQNITDVNYETYGTYSPTDSVPILQVPTASNTRSLSPGAPVAGFGGVRVTF